MQLTYTIKFVADMDQAVAFHRDSLGLPLKFQTSGWSEFDTGQTTLALHAASDKNPAGTVELGYTVEDLKAFYASRDDLGVRFTEPPHELHGSLLARFLDSEGVECSVSG